MHTSPQIVPDLFPTQGQRLVNLDLVETIDATRVRHFEALDRSERSAKGQFGTPTPVAKLMASMFGPIPDDVRLLDAGAGVGSLTAALVAEICARAGRPKRIAATVVESDADLTPVLESNLEACAIYCEERGVRFEHTLVTDDFIDHVVSSEADLFGSRSALFNCAIQNPPYRKIRSSSRYRRQLSALGIEVSNLYAAFVALTIRLLEPDGQLVAITPRSFCNGPYFDSFRSDFLRRMALRSMHLFDSRTEAFAGDSVLQENVITHASATRLTPASVTITTSSGAPSAAMTIMDVPYDQVVPPGTTNPAIHLITDGVSAGVADRMQDFGSSLGDLGIKVSTGRVVDFRAKEHLRPEPGPGDAPLIYPMHLRDGAVRWPVPGARKPNAIAVNENSGGLLVPPGRYVLTKRFSSKEQRRRIDAYIYDSDAVSPGPAGFENHVNYIHEAGKGLDRELANGLFVYLNSSLVDMYFRLFSGHTQVNATDLRNMPFPERASLRRVGARVESLAMTQDEIDALFDEELASVAERKTVDPVATNKRVMEARDVLKALGFPPAQTNARSALVLLALLDLKQSSKWSKATNPLRGIMRMMDWFDKHYGKKYAANTRETVRRYTVHQFLDAGLIVRNPDDSGRAVNSDKTVYQVVPEALGTVRKFGTKKWDAALGKYLNKISWETEVWVADSPGHMTHFNGWHLNAGSGCIDAGSANEAPTSDFEGDPRPAGLGHDIGVNEAG